MASGSIKRIWEEPAQAWVGQATAARCHRAHGTFIEHGCEINASLSARVNLAVRPGVPPLPLPAVVARAPSRARTRGHVSVRNEG